MGEFFVFKLSESKHLDCLLMISYVRLRLQPPYVSNIIFELWKSSPAGEHYVRILYNRNALDTSKVCGGGDKCSLRALRHKVLAPYMLTRQQREAECLMHFTHDEPAGEHVKEVPVTIGSSITEE